jgi:Transposase DNA-binding/Transposase Tn5 dimerisation domain
MSWVSEELRELDLGDVRLDLRLMEMIERLAEQCERSVPQAFGSWAEVKGAYRLWENSRVEWQAILAPHRDQIVRRAAEHPVVLAIQDTTEINLTSRPATTGLGYLGASYCRGLLLHTCLAVTPSGLVLGVLDQQIWARPPSTLGKSKQRHQLPTADKESQRWLTGLAACGAGLSDHPQVVVVGDRESDFYDFFVAPRPAHVELLVRVQHESRKLESFEATIKEALAAAPVQGELLINVPRSGSRKARQARLSVRFLGLPCPPPHPRCRNPELPRVPLQWILVEETAPPSGTKPIRWLLATTLPVETLEDAVRCVDYYARRWTIERFHFTLKSGCQVEERALESRENLERMLATMSIVAWRVMWLVSASREQPDDPCTVILCEPEWQTLYAVTHRKKPRPLPAQPPTLREAVRMIAALGGFLGRKGDGEPGLKAVWQGLARLSDMTTGWLMKHPPPSASTNSESCG